MKKVIGLALLTMVAFLFSTTAMAYDDLITDDTSAVKEAKAMTGKASILFQTAGKGFDNEGEDTPDYADDTTHIRVPLKFSYVVMDNLEAFAILPIVSLDAGGDSNSGIGDIWLGAKYAVMPEGMLTVRGALDLPVGDDDKFLGNAGGFGIDVAAMTAKQIDAIGLNGQLGLRYNVEDGDTKWQPGIGIYVDVEGSYKFTDMLAGQLGLEYTNVGDGKADGTDVDKSGIDYLDLNIGACYMVSDTIGVKGDILYTLMGTNYNAFFGVLIGLNYNF